MGQPERDGHGGQNGIAKTGQTEQDTQNRTDITILLGSDSQSRTAGTGQPDRDSQSRMARMRLPDRERQNRTSRTGPT
jgi:hypothetical protein